MSVEEEYEANVGKPPENLPDDHPDKWQWDYRGTSDERAGLLDRLAGNDVTDIEDEGPPQEETLW